jgi:glucoamylase
MPLPKITHRALGLELTLEVICDPLREVVLVRYHLQGDRGQVFCFLTPRLAVLNESNAIKLTDVAFDMVGGDRHLHFCSDQGFRRRGMGHFSRTSCHSYVEQQSAIDWDANELEGDDIVAVAELAQRQGVLSLGFAFREKGGETLARSSLAEGFDSIMARAQAGWEAWRSKLAAPDGLPSRWFSEVEVSAAVLKACEERLYPGALVASLCAPWGGTRDDLAGYHLVWPRDSAKMGFAMIALKNYDDARQMATYLLATQQSDGSWSQNFYPDGAAYWNGCQLDDTGLPLLLIAKLAELGQLGELQGVTDLVRRACQFLVAAGPVTQQDRWEEQRGISIFTLAVVIAALVGVSRFIEDELERVYLLSYADYLNRRIEDWLYVEGTHLAHKHDVAGYYLRMATPHIFDGRGSRMVIANSGEEIDLVDMVAVDYMYLARLGLRQARDARMQHSLRVVEGELCVNTEKGPAFYRYTHDAYGEHPDGSPFDGTGQGRLWPLLTGERGHLAVFLSEDSGPYLDAMCEMSNRAGLIPEQIWDGPPIPQRRLYPGEPTGSATPLLWAHAEFLSLASATATGKSVELLKDVDERYRGRRPEPKVWHWRADAPFQIMPPEVDLLIEAPSPFELRYAAGSSAAEVEASSPLGLGRHGVRLAASKAPRESRITFTIADEASERIASVSIES